MTKALFRELSPEELELARRRRELSAVRAVLAERERELGHLRDLLHSFEGRYIRQVGVLYRQLDEWEQRIAELEVSRESMEETEARLRAAQAAEAARAEANTGVSPLPLVGRDDKSRVGVGRDDSVGSEVDLRGLFREVAKRIHPDFAVDHHDERQRNRLMAQANEAFRREDAELLQRMLNGYDPATDSWAEEDAAAARERTLGQIERARADIVAVEEKLAEMGTSELAELRVRTVEAATGGRDLLAEMAARVKGSIGMAMRRFELDSIRARRGEARLNAEALVTAEISSPKS
jgi:hypothetical protein